MIALWDLGNVVVRWEPETILKMLDYPPEQTEYLRTGLLGHPDWLDLDRGVTTEAVVAERLVAESGLTLTQALRCFDVVRESLVDLQPSVDVLYEMQAAGIPMYVLSNMSLVNAEFLRSRQYFKLFEGIVISAEEKLVKPDAALFRLVLDRYQLDPSEVFFIDDSQPNIEAAEALGMQALHFHRSADCYAALRTRIAQHRQ